MCWQYSRGPSVITVCLAGNLVEECDTEGEIRTSVSTVVMFTAKRLKIYDNALDKIYRSR